MEKVSRFDRISRRGVHLPFRGVKFQSGFKENDRDYMHY